VQNFLTVRFSEDCEMTASGQPRRPDDVCRTSAYPPTTAVERTWRHFAFVTKNGYELPPKFQFNGWHLAAQSAEAVRQVLAPVMMTKPSGPRFAGLISPRRAK
jgi:hypothetical protein